MPGRTEQDQLDIESPIRSRKKMYRTKAEISSAFKSARDIMRKDAGLNGDLDRLPQLSWLLFLRVFSERVDRFRSMEDLDYEPVLAERYRWETWGANEELTGDALLKFVNEDLLPHLGALKGHGADDPRSVISAVFQGVNNQMLSGTLLRGLVNIIDRIDFQADDTVHTMAFVYESIMKEMRDAAGGSGEFYTPRPVIRFMTEQSFLKFEDSVLDPACGTGGFLVAALEELKPHAKSSVKLAQLHNKIRGIEKKPLPYLLCVMNLLLHDVDTPRVVRDNALTRMRDETSPSDRVDVIVTNPPFGSEEESSVAARFPKGYSTRNTAWLFLYSVIERLKPGGRCAIVLPNGPLFETHNSAGLIKEKLMRECNLHTIVRLPQGVLAPYTHIPTNLMFFEKTGPTKETWYYEIPLPEGRRGYTKTRPMQYEDFKDCAEWWGGTDRQGREQNEHAWKVAAKEIKADSYNLDVANPRNGDDLTHGQLGELVDKLIDTENELIELLREIRTNLMSDDTSRLPQRPLGEVLTLSRRGIHVLETESYQITGIYSFGRGLIRRSSIQGNETAYKSLTPLCTGQLVMSKLNAWEGAFAVVSSEFDGTYVSPEFPVFDIDEESASVDYIRHLVTWPQLWKRLTPSGSVGRRKRTSPETLLSTIVPLPALSEQEAISKVLDQLARLRQTAQEQALHVSTLHTSILNAAFTGQL